MDDVLGDLDVFPTAWGVWWEVFYTVFEGFVGWISLRYVLF